MNKSQVHWRDASRQPKLFFISANAAYPMLLFFMHIRWWTFILMISVVTFLSIIEYFGFTPDKFFRVTRNFLVGNMKYKKGWWQR